MNPEHSKRSVHFSLETKEDYGDATLHTQEELCKRILESFPSEHHNDVLLREWFTSGRAQRYGDLMDSDPEMQELAREYMIGKSEGVLDKIILKIDKSMQH
jgi:hypothetical protein